MTSGGQVMAKPVPSPSQTSLVSFHPSQSKAWLPWAGSRTRNLESGASNSRHLLHLRYHAVMIRRENYP